MNIIYSASGVLTVFFIGLLMGKSRKGLADYILVGWFLLILLVIATTYLNHNQIEGWQGFFELTDGSVFLHGPIMWFYVRTLTEKNFRFHWLDLWHLLPFVIGTTILMLPLRAGSTVSDPTRNVILVNKMLVLLAYEVGVLWRLYRHESQIEDYFSFTEKVDLNWLKLLVWGFMVIWIIGAVSQFFYFFGVEIPQYGGLVTNLALSLFVLVIGFFGIRQTNIFVSPTETESSQPIVPAVQEPTEVSDPRYDRLLAYMETQKPYLDGELTLYKLAVQLQLPPHQLSQLINQHGGTNFFHFVNQYRVREVQARIQEKVHLKQTLLAIALDCGFNSKASFNRVFKKISGKTPRQYAEEAEGW
jgi:AraC-like DNA-binding protein